MTISTSVVCFSLAPNLGCVFLNPVQFGLLIIPPAIEFIFCLSLILVNRNSGRAHLLLTADGVVYFILALIDLLSHVLPAVRISLATSKVMDIVVRSTSCVPMLLYTSYLFWLSYREFITNLPPRHQFVPKYLFIILIPVVAAMNEVASFVGAPIQSPSNSQTSLIINFTDNSESLWLNLSQVSLALYTAFQILFFLLAFYRLGAALLDEHRIEKTQTDEHHFFNGIGWITVGIKLGVIESLVGFARGGFAVPLSRRILRLIARSFLIIGVLKGMDARENFESLTNELATWRRSSRRFSNFRSKANRPMSSWASRFPGPTHVPSQNVHRNTSNRHVTVHHERGRAPFLQIRFSAFNFPDQSILADGSGTQAQRQSDLSCYVPQIYSSQNRSPEFDTRHNSGQTISDNMSVIRELALRFPLPPRVTGQYRGSILGQAYEDDDVKFPIVGSRREPSTRRNTAQSFGDGGLSTSGSIKRKPAPPLLPVPQYAYIMERPVSLWGGLKYQHSVVESSSSANIRGESGDTLLRRPTPRQLFNRASKAISDVSVRSAEWLASARSESLIQPHLITARINSYRRGGLRHAPAELGNVTSGSDEEMLNNHDWPSDDASPAAMRMLQILTHLNVGQVPMRMTPSPTSTIAEFSFGRTRITSTHGDVQGFS